MSKNKLLLVDGNLLMFQSFYASFNPNFPDNVLRAPNGITTNGVHVFFQTLFKVLKLVNPTHLFIAFDAHGETKRHQIFEDYKSGRSKAPVIIYEQFDAVKEILTSMKIKWFEKIGDEADDLIATLASNNKGFDNIVFSKDKDLLQLVCTNTSILQTSKSFGGNLTYKVINLHNFKEEYGINPEQIPDYKGLAGDSSDNLKGVQGIGPKTAITLLNEFGTLENIYNNIETLKGKVKENLLNDKESGFFCKQLATLNENVDMDKNIDSYIINIDEAGTTEAFNKYGLNAVLKAFWTYLK
ncbi:5'-3' exonuclease [Mycoplasmopsis felifaucium]|uniref:5'-3' exonuclease n=1 Tax=Mycoplasmopsis felifaucium TaxID=35768 RepID=UPI0004835DA5|nr:5'-3' exonuclease [Mycoplasmopsis felifaucium]